MIPVDLLLYAYRSGAFPMATPSGEIEWFSPNPRGLIPLDDRFHIPHGLARELKKGRFEIRISTQFEAVMRACGEREETWINEEVLASYVELHRLGYAHSVEAWQGGALVGGLYGVALGGAFFGESMFHTVTDASKVALHALVMRLRARKFHLLDTQWTTAHLRNFGCYELSRAKYLKLLNVALEADCAFA